MGRWVGDRKAEEEPIVQLSATTTTPRDARPADAQQARDLWDTPLAAHRPFEDGPGCQQALLAAVRADQLDTRRQRPARGYRQPQRGHAPQVHRPGEPADAEHVP